MIAAFGLYELLITRIDPSRLGMRLPGWLRMNDLNDLKARVISMIILVAAVTFVDVVVETEPDGGLNTFYLVPPPGKHGTAFHIVWFVAVVAPVVMLTVRQIVGPTTQLNGPLGAWIF